MRRLTVILGVLMSILTVAALADSRRESDGRIHWRLSRVPEGIRSAEQAYERFRSEAGQHDLWRLGLSGDQIEEVNGKVTAGQMKLVPAWPEYAGVTFSKFGAVHGPVVLHFTTSAYRVENDWGDVDLLQNCGNMAFLPRTPAPPKQEVQTPPPPPPPPVQQMVVPTPSNARAEAKLDARWTIEGNTIVVNVTMPSPPQQVVMREAPVFTSWGVTTDRQSWGGGSAGVYATPGTGVSVSNSNTNTNTVTPPVCPPGQPGPPPPICPPPGPPGPHPPPGPPPNVCPPGQPGPPPPPGGVLPGNPLPGPNPNLRP